MVKVLVFGTFDGVHDGHRAMLKQAKELGSYLVAAIAPDEVVNEIKGFMPKNTAAARIAGVRAERIADEVTLADGELHSWEIISRLKPNIIALGHDQDELQASLERHLEISYPDIETEAGFQTNPKKPTIVRLNYYDRHRTAPHKS